MSDYPRGGDIQATRDWLHKEGFKGKFSYWEAEALLGKDDACIKSKFENTAEANSR